MNVQFPLSSMIGEFVYEDKFTRLYFDAHFRLMTILCLPETELMTDNDYVNNRLEYVNILKHYSPKLLLIDAATMFFVITPTLQEWTVSEVTAVEVAVGVKKQAIIVSTSIFSQASLEQTIDEEQEVIQTAYFEDLEEAKNWLLKK